MRRKIPCLASLVGRILFIGLMAALGCRFALPQSTPAHFAYVFDCSGQYIRIAMHDGSMEGPFSVPGIPPGTGRFDGCLIESVVAGPDPAEVFLVVPMQRLADSLGRSRDKILALHVSGLRLLSSLDIPVPTNHIPKVKLDVASHTLQVQYRTPSAARKRVQYDVDISHPDHIVFKARADGKNSSDNLDPQPLLSDRAYTDVSGKVIDGNRIIEPNGTTTSVTGYELLTASMAGAFRDLLRPGGTGHAFLDIVFADSAAGRMAFIVGWDRVDDPSPAGGGIVVYDAVDGKVVSSFHSPYREAAYELTPDTPTVHLTRDGRTVIVEEYQWVKPDGGSHPKRARTGRIGLYSADDGRLLRTVQTSAAADGSGRVLGFSPDRALVFYVRTHDLYLIDVLGSRDLVFPMPTDFYPARVITTNQ
jgi:hypothetical protein